MLWHTFTFYSEVNKLNLEMKTLSQQDYRLQFYYLTTEILPHIVYSIPNKKYQPLISTYHFQSTNTKLYTIGSK